MYSSTDEKAYNISAMEKHDEAMCYAKKVWYGRVEMAAVMAGLSILDLLLFYEPITAVRYDSSEFSNTLLCVVCAILPIVLAVLSAHFIRQAQFGEENRGVIYAAFAISSAAFTVVLLVVGWQVRDAYWGESAGFVGLLLNVVAVSAALAAFAADYVFARKLILWEARKNEAEIERSVLELMDYQAQFIGMDESDVLRRRADDAAFYRECGNVIVDGLDAAARARRELACRIAKSPEEREHVMSTPLQVGPEQIVGKTNSEVFERTCSSIGVPSLAELEKDWPLPTNSHYLCEDQAEKLRQHEGRLRRVRGILATKAANDEGRDGNEEPVAVRAEVVCL